MQTPEYIDRVAEVLIEHTRGTKTVLMIDL